MRHKCDNCDKKFNENDLINPIPDFHQRTAPGGIIPSGECPKCGALCYPETKDDEILKKNPKSIPHAVNVHGEGWQVKVPNRSKAASKWFTVCDCYANPLTGDAKETAIKISQLLDLKPQGKFKPSRKDNPYTNPYTNNERAERALATIQAHFPEESQDESNLRDVLADMMHLCHRDGISFEEQLLKARFQFQFEM